MKRLKFILASIWSAFLGKKEGQYHREILDLTYEQMTDGLVEVKRDLANVATAKHRILQLVEKARTETLTLESNAVGFLNAGDEQSARESLERKAAVSQQLVQLESQAAGISIRQKALEDNQRELETRISAFKAEKEVIKARYSAAQATARIGETVTGISKDAREATKAVGRITEQTEELEARGDALSELIQGGSLEDVFNPGQSPLDRRALEMARNEAVENDLARLRKQIGQGTPAPTGGGS
jgi:phage shock protein A